MISSVVLAAGRADRMGEQKLLLPLGGKSVLQWVLESALASDRHEIVCVVRDLEAVRRESLWWLTGYIGLRMMWPIVVKALRSLQASGPSTRKVTERSFSRAISQFDVSSLTPW
jgi:hypothetical protein